MLNKYDQMPAYHSSFNEQDGDFVQACSVTLLPLRTTVRGPAPKLSEAETKDIIDECLTYFRANMFFSAFDVNGGADRLLIYLTLYAAQCIKRCQKVKDKKDSSSLSSSLLHKGALRVHDPRFGRALRRPRVDLRRFSLEA